MIKKIYCINLAERKEKMTTVLSQWNDFKIQRINAVDTRPNGVLGCYQSHLLTYQTHLKTLKNNNQHLLVIEDDAVPCPDFKTRLNVILKQLPSDWNICLLGCWPMQSHQTIQVTENLHKAKSGILGGHCYLVNANFIKEIIKVYQNSSQHNGDYLIKVLQSAYNVYVAIPALSYQQNNFSDTSFTATDCTGTKQFYKHN